MKKIYISPTMTVVAVAMQKMIAASSENEVSIGSDDYNGDEVGSRRGSSWDDDDE